MAESLGQSNPVADSGCSFSSHCGRNVNVDGSIARWNSVVSGGRVVVDKPISPGKELKLSFDGKGHAEVGILTKDPASIPDINQVENLKELTVIQSARIYKKTGTAIVRRSDCGREIITEADKTSNVKVRRTDKVWVTINIMFGDLEVEIETEGYNFSNKRGGNIQLENNDTWANLKAQNPCAVCFVGNPIRRKEALNFQIDPILRDGKPPRNFSTKIAISQFNPMDIMSGNDTYYDLTSLPVIHFDEFPNKCKNEIQIGVSENGTVQINFEKGTLKKETNNEQIYCIFEICRVQLHCKGKTVPFSLSTPLLIDPAEKDQHKIETKHSKKDDKSSAKDVNVPDAIVVPPRFPDAIVVPPCFPDTIVVPPRLPDSFVVPPNSDYVHSKRILESIRNDAECISLHSEDFDPCMESRNIDNPPFIVNHGSKMESGSSNNEPSPLRENIALLHSKIEDLNSRLQSIEETIVNRDTGKEPMQQNQFQDLKLEIQAIKKMLIVTKTPGRSRTTSKNRTSTGLDDYHHVTAVLRTNYVKLVSMIDAVPLSDILFQSNYISLNECDKIGKLCQMDRENANRELLNILMRRQSVDLDKLKSVLRQSKQTGVLAVLFPDE